MIFIYEIILYIYIYIYIYIYKDQANWLLPIGKRVLCIKDLYIYKDQARSALCRDEQGPTANSGAKSVFSLHGKNKLAINSLVIWHARAADELAAATLHRLSPYHSVMRILITLSYTCIYTYIYTFICRLHRLSPYHSVMSVHIHTHIYI